MWSYSSQIPRKRITAHTQRKKRAEKGLLTLSNALMLPEPSARESSE